ncbi:MAG: hypothetical protein ACREAM_10795 [Blastocatellia bacterium]
MVRKTDAERRGGAIHRGLFAVALGLLAVLPLGAAGQDATRAAGKPATIRDAQSSARVNPQLTLVELFSLPGRIIAQGTNEEPAGALGLKTYRLEEVTLPQPFQAQVNGVARQMRIAYRFTVTGGPFRVRSLPPVLWIDGEPFIQVQESEDLSALVTIVFNRSILQEGASITVSYGLEDPNPVTLPERLSFSNR